MLDDDCTTLVAGVGNIFRRDDAFGSEVARRLAAQTLPPGVQVVDYGIGGIHLAYDLLDGVELLVLVDALPRGEAPGTLTVLEAAESSLARSGVDSHAMDPAAVLASVRSLGGRVPPTLVVGCEPGDVTDGMGLTPEVEASLAPAVALVRRVLEEHHVADTTSVG